MPRSRPQNSTTRTRRRASITVEDIQSPETPHLRRPVLPSLPNSEPANLPTRRRSRPSTVSSRARQARGETHDDTEDDSSDAEDDDQDPAGHDRLLQTPWPTCHRRVPGLNTPSNSSSRSSSPDDSSDPIESGSDTSLDLSSLSLESAADSPVPSIDFQKKNPGPRPRVLIDKKVLEAMRRNALKPKKARRGLDGYVYVLADKSHPGYVKIGNSGKDPYVRCGEIQRSCKAVYPEVIEGQDFTMVPCSIRLEGIIFDDLWHERQQFPCNCRNKTHIEWFKMSKEEALLRVRLWQDWMRREPYDAKGLLKPEWLERIKKHQETPSAIVEAEHASGNGWQTFMKEF